MRVLALALVLTAAPAVIAQSRYFIAQLTGAQVVNGPGDPDGTGTLYLTQDRYGFHFEVVVDNITMPPTWVRLPANPLYDFNLSGPWQGNRLVVSVTRGVHGSMWFWLTYTGYVVVQTADYPNGAIAGRLLPVSVLEPIPAASTPALVALGIAVILAGLFALRRL